MNLGLDSHEVHLPTSPGKRSVQRFVHIALALRIGGELVAKPTFAIAAPPAHQPTRTDQPVVTLAFKAPPHPGVWQQPHAGKEVDHALGSFSIGGWFSEPFHELAITMDREDRVDVIGRDLAQKKPLGLEYGKSWRLHALIAHSASLASRQRRVGRFS